MLVFVSLALTSSSQQLLSCSSTCTCSAVTMSHFCTSHFHNGCYDTQFSMPIMLQQPGLHYLPLFPVIPYSTWSHESQIMEAPNPITRNQSSAPNPLSSQFASQAAAPPVKPVLRSILKHGRFSRSNKAVHFTPSTASPPPAKRGMYKYAGRPRAAKARHPVRGHPCLSGEIRQRAQQTTAAFQTPPPTQCLTRPSSSPTPATKRTTETISRSPTPPSADFFRSANMFSCTVQRPSQPFQLRSNIMSLRQQAQQRSIPKQTPAHNVHYNRPDSRYSEESNTDATLAKILQKTTLMKDRDVQKQPNKAEVDTAATRRSLQALARDFDRKNAWRRRR